MSLLHPSSSSRNARHLARSFTGSVPSNASTVDTSAACNMAEPLANQSVHYDSIYDSTEFFDQRNSIEVMRKRLKYHFMSPYGKFMHRGRKPWKLVMQLLKLVVVTAQV